MLNTWGLSDDNAYNRAFVHFADIENDGLSIAGSIFLQRKRSLQNLLAHGTQRILEAPILNLSESQPSHHASTLHKSRDTSDANIY